MKVDKENVTRLCLGLYTGKGMENGKQTKGKRGAGRGDKAGQQQSDLHGGRVKVEVRE